MQQQLQRRNTDGFQNNFQPQTSGTTTAIVNRLNHIVIDIENQRDTVIDIPDERTELEQRANEIRNSWMYRLDKILDPCQETGNLVLATSPGTFATLGGCIGFWTASPVQSSVVVLQPNVPTLVYPSMSPAFQTAYTALKGAYLGYFSSIVCMCGALGFSYAFGEINKEYNGIQARLRELPMPSSDDAGVTEGSSSSRAPDAPSMTR